MSLLKLISLVLVVKICAAYPRYVVVPLAELERYGYEGPLQDFYPYAESRKLQAEESVPQFRYQQEDEEYYPEEPTYEVQEQPRKKRQNIGGKHGGYNNFHDDQNDKVDYGGYTGNHGAFGWYTDHPVIISAGGKH